MNTMNEMRPGEAGIVSIMVTMITMIVISLIILGFADVARNEQRSSLDSQLSTQAYYAAESGVNDARAVMESKIAAGSQLPDKTICGNDGNYSLSPPINVAYGVSYPCVLINASPPALSYNVGYTSTVIPLLSSGGAFGTITLTWKAANGTPGNLGPCYPSGGNAPGQFVVAGQWGCDYPVLRVDLLDATNTLTRASWNNVTATDFFVPVNNGGLGTARLSDRGAAIGARCTAPANTCVARYTGVNSKRLYMRVTTLYQTNSLLTLTSAGNKFTGAEAIIDSTGKAQDVLRRIMVAVDLTDANSRKIPSAAIVTDDSICKRYGVTAGSFDVYDDLSAGGGGNPLCNKQSAGSPIP